jgi:hypothetical protein
MDNEAEFIARLTGFGLGERDSALSLFAEAARKSLPRSPKR